MQSQSLLPACAAFVSSTAQGQGDIPARDWLIAHRPHNLTDLNPIVDFYPCLIREIYEIKRSSLSSSGSCQKGERIAAAENRQLYRKTAAREHS
jgi:hypothetical protein